MIHSDLLRGEGKLSTFTKHKSTRILWAILYVFDTLSDSQEVALGYPSDLHSSSFGSSPKRNLRTGKEGQSSHLKLSLGSKEGVSK